MTTPVIIDCNNLTLGYKKHLLIQSLTCHIHGGELIALIGANGTGKSTLLKAFIGEISPINGKLSMAIERQKIAYMPQNNVIEKHFPISVFDMVASGLWHQIGFLKGLNHAQFEQIDHVLDLVNLSNLAHQPLHTLSGGQLQKARFARMILQDADLLLLDEPFNAIDETTIRELLQLLLKLHQQGRTIISAVHNIHLVRQYFPNCLLLRNHQAHYAETNDILAKFPTELSQHVYADHCQHPSI